MPILRPLLHASLAVALCAATSACSDPEAARRAQEAAAAQREAAAAAALTEVRDARTSQRPELAHVYAEKLLQQYPGSRAANELAAEMTAIRAAADAAREHSRLEKLWVYHAVEDKKARGTVYTAYLNGETDAVEAPTLRLVLRRHPEWGQDTFLQMENGDFACKGDCPTQLQFDAKAERFPLSRADGAPVPTLFIDDDKRLLARVDAAKTLQFTLPVSDRRSITWRFELAGFDSSRLGPAVDAK